MPILNLGQSASTACDVFQVFKSGPSKLVPTGLGGIDGVIGGLFPGSAGILAAATGVGKSSLVLTAAFNSSQPVGIISTEDTPDVLGSRALAHASGVDSLNIRTKKLSDADKKRLKTAQEELSSKDTIHVAYEVGAPLESVLQAVDDLAFLGCKIIWVDYIQKIRGVREDRRNEVSTVYTKIQHACDKAGVACMMISQFSRQADPTRPPQIWWLKESGDLENEARLILLASRDQEDRNKLCVRVAKCTFGGEGTIVTYVRNEAGVLEEDSPSYG